MQQFINEFDLGVTAKYDTVVFLNEHKTNEKKLSIYTREKNGKLISETIYLSFGLKSQLHTIDLGTKFTI